MRSKLVPRQQAACMQCCQPQLRPCSSSFHRPAQCRAQLSTHSSSSRNHGSSCAAPASTLQHLQTSCSPCAVRALQQARCRSSPARPVGCRAAQNDSQRPSSSSSSFTPPASPPQQRKPPDPRTDFSRGVPDLLSADEATESGRERFWGKIAVIVLGVCPRLAGCRSCIAAVRNLLRRAGCARWRAPLWRRAGAGYRPRCGNLVLGGEQRQDLDDCSPCCGHTHTHSACVRACSHKATCRSSQCWALLCCVSL